MSHPYLQKLDDCNAARRAAFEAEMRLAKARRHPSSVYPFDLLELEADAARLRKISVILCQVAVDALKRSARVPYSLKSGAEIQRETSQRNERAMATGTDKKNTERGS